MSIKERIDQDLKKAMLAGEKELVTTLRGLKSVILYAELEQGKRDSGLSEDQTLSLLSKESKKRRESADLYTQGGNSSKAAAELIEKGVIDAYLPTQLDPEQLGQIIDTAIQRLGVSDVSAMGQVISAVKQKAGATADGAMIAGMVKKRLQSL